MGHGQPVYNAQVASLPSSEQMLSASEALSPPSGALLGLAAAIGPTIAFFLPSLFGLETRLTSGHL